MHSVLFKIGPITIFSYGFMLMVAFVVGTAVAIQEARRQKLEAEAILDMAPWILVASIVGARLAFVVQNLGEFSQHPLEVVQVWTGGLTFYGGLAGGLLAGVWYAWRRRLPFWRFADVIAPSLALGYAIGRIGCFLNGCCYGSPTDLPWACRFHDSTLPGGITPPSHPTQLYAAAISIGIFFLLRNVARRASVPGQVLLAYGILYALYRFGIEFLRRGATADVLAAGITTGQLVSLLLFILGIGGWVLLARRNTRAQELSVPAPARPGATKRR